MADLDLAWSPAARAAAIASRRAHAKGKPVAGPSQPVQMIATKKVAKANGQIRDKRAGTAIAVFQKTHGLKVTGDYNPATAKAAAAAAKKNPHHLLARAVHQISKAQHGANWKADEKKAAHLIEHRQTKRAKRIAARSYVKGSGRG